MSSTASTAVGGKAGAAAAGKPSTSPGIKELNAQTPGDGKGSASAPEVTSSTSATTEDKGGGGNGRSDNQTKNDKTTELLHEATQLLKSLEVQPKIQAMRISELEHSQPGQVLIDSGATHAQRPARDLDEWQKAERTVVTLADGATTRFRLKHGTKILLSEPGQQEAWIVPVSGLTQLDFALQWRGDQCLVKDDEGRDSSSNPTRMSDDVSS